MYFLIRDQKLARNFCFRPTFRAFWQNIILTDKNMYFLAGNQNQPEISVSGWILAAWKNFQNQFLGIFWTFLTLNVVGGPNFRAFWQKIFWLIKICIFLAEKQIPARNFSFRTNFGCLKKFVECDFCAFFENFWFWTWTDVPNFVRYGKNFFGRRQKIGQKFLFPAEFCPLEKIFKIQVLCIFKNFWLWKWPEVWNFGCFGKKVFGR